ncbi:MAG: right-handed parallel beta-helix repeat-containing protein, partial [Bacteroidales bacterium]
MKKIIFLILIFFPLLLYAQPEYGDGSSGNPYRGTITTPWTLNGDYYCGDLSVTSGVFTIFAGSTLRFGTGNILTISGTGVLSADGTSTDPITFTSSGSTWGHIWFNAPSETNQSVLDYCIIENGDVHSFTDYRGYGGAIHANLSNLTISNCMLRNNYAYWGGAIFVNKSKNPSISNCYIYNNQSSRGGGGIYCWNNSSSVIQNCIFESNVCLEISIPYYSGGGLCAQSYTAVKIINCTFVNNTTTQANGAGIELYSSNNARVINSVFWGSDNQVYLHLTNGNTIINSAIQGSVPSGSVNSIVLNSVNSNPQGPNFNDPDNNDWSIKFISPCRDAGVNSYTGVTIPSKDYIDSSRIGTTDIGAYEVQYSRWTGTTDHTWSTASNWDKNVDPSTGTGDVIIPSGCSQYPDVSTTQDFSILYGNYMIIEPGASVTLDELTNNNGGTLNLKSDATGMFSLMFNSYSGTGTVNTQIYLTGGDAGSGQYRWHYIAVPKTMSKSVLTDINPYNLLRYDDSRITDAKEQGWQWHDGWNGSEPVPSDAFSTLDETRGYNFYHTTNVTATLTTTSLLASIGQINLQNSYPASNLFGWNLVGNSLTCALNWDNVTKSSSVRNAVYYTKNNAMAAYVNGEGVNGGDKYVPPLQGFFVKTDANDEYINLTNAKVHRTSQTYYKKGSSTLERSRIR